MAERKRYISKKFKTSPLIECSCGCGEKLTLYDTEGRERKYLSGHNGRKYDDPSQYKREWNHRNRKKRYEYKKQYSHKRKSKLLKLKGGECECCHEKYDETNACIFDFHHKYPNEKEFGLGLLTMTNRAWNAIIKEADKCIILCSNCHRKKHSSEY